MWINRHAAYFGQKASMRGRLQETECGNGCGRRSHESLSITQAYYRGGNRYQGREGEVRRVSEYRDIGFNQTCGDSKL
jgi:hypothetical protein